MIIRFLDYINAHVLPQTLHVVLVFMPVWGPVLLVYVLWKVWMLYIRTEFIAKQKPMLLEIRLPKEINKSPLAMEIVLTALWQSGTTTLIEKYWDGKVKPWFSLEIASDEGHVKFYIWTWAKFKNLVEAQVYAQYPTVEVHEVTDYTEWIYHDPENLPMWGAEFKLTQPDPFPIKTYVDYGLHEDPKEEFKIDPITAVLEFLGSMKKGEHLWMQFIIQAHTKDRRKKGTWFQKTDWKDEAKEEVDKILEEIKSKEPGVFPRPMTDMEKDKIAAIERSISKYGFDTGIRIGYIAEKAEFKPVGITGIIGCLRQYNSNTLNGFKLANFTSFDYPWQDILRIRQNRNERRFLTAYRRRAFFHPPFNRRNLAKKKPLILTTEELATMFHFPGGVAQTPTLDRIESKKVEAPSNLPI